MRQLHNFYKNTIIHVVPLLFLLTASTAYAGQYSHTYNFSRPEFTVSDNSTQDNIIHNISLAGTQNDVSTPGAPTLPIAISKLLIKANEKILAINVSPSSFVTLDDNYQLDFTKQPIPLSFIGPILETQPDAIIYGTHAYYPNNIYTPKGTGHLHGSSIVHTALHPVRYNPVTGSIGYFTQITVNIETTTNDNSYASLPTNTITSRQRPSDRDQILSLVDNDDTAANILPALTAASPENFDREYLIITTNV